MHRVLLACSILLGCAGGAAPKSPESTAPDASDEPVKQPAEATSESTTQKPRDAAPQAATNEDVQAVLQLVIDDEALGPYLHLDKPDRFPVRVSGRELPQGIELTKATKPVLIVPEGEADKKPTIVFTEIQVTGDEASVRYRYDVEKVRGASSLKRRDGQWVLVRSRVSEH